MSALLCCMLSVTSKAASGRELCQRHTPAPVNVETYGDSDFLRAVADVPPDKAWEIMDELMDSLKIVNERVYNSVMRKLEK